MKVFLIPDKFKGSLTASEVIDAIRTGILSVYPEAVFQQALVSDGGDGFLQAIEQTVDAIYIKTNTNGPLDKLVRSVYLLDRDQKTAFIELAQASGLTLLDQEERNPLKTTTLGTGQQMLDAYRKGARKLFIGIGGSATNDGGMGIAKAFGYRFLSYDSTDLPPVGGSLESLIKIIKPELFPVDLEVIAVNDVNNPLYGPKGAAYVYAQQKGASAAVVEQLDRGLQNLEKVVKRDLGQDCAKIPGSGAAGGAAYGLRAFFNAAFIGGTDFIMEMNRIREHIVADKPDLLITGEGKIDDQTFHGKLIQGVMKLGSDFGIPVLAVCGSSEVSSKLAKTKGLKDIIEVGDPQKDLEYNMKNAAELTRNAVGHYFQKSRD